MARAAPLPRRAHAFKLAARAVRKPWGRRDIPHEFAIDSIDPVGEIWFEDPADAASPLLVKYLFTSQRLSIQVHPDNASAAEFGFTQGKDECWLVLDASSDAELGVGLTRTVDANTLRAAALSGDIENLIDWRPARTGDFVYNPARTIHAIGAGLMVVEIQQNIDSTLRLYDYGRPRELHVDAAVAIANRAPHNDPRDRHLSGTEAGCIPLVSGPYFHVARVAAPFNADILPFGRPITVVPLKGACIVGDLHVAFGECARTDDAHSIMLLADAEALLCWAE